MPCTLSLSFFYMITSNSKKEENLKSDLMKMFYLQIKQQVISRNRAMSHSLIFHFSIFYGFLIIIICTLLSHSQNIPKCKEEKRGVLCLLLYIAINDLEGQHEDFISVKESILHAHAYIFSLVTKK